jgi:hypothetical protein
MLRHVSILRALLLFCFIAMAASAQAAQILTVVQSRSFPGFWLEETTGQQGIAHGQVVAAHDVTSDALTPANLEGKDIVYLPTLNASVTPAEASALVQFVIGGGRLILVGDHGGALNFPVLAASFSVTYGGTLGDPGQIHVAQTIEPTTSPMVGVGGLVQQFSANTPNGELSSTHADFEVLAQYAGGETALGRRPVGNGEVLFLTDINTFDDARLASHDNQALWTNLFDFDGNVVATEASTWSQLKSGF